MSCIGNTIFPEGGTEMLTNKTIYIVTTGATKVKSVSMLLNQFKQEKANCVLIPTSMSCSMMDWDSINGFNIRKDYAGEDSENLPEEDIVVVAPCTFNSFSKIAHGIADNYPMSILHAAIGKNKHVVIAPAMNYWYFNHPLTKENLSKISSYDNVSIVYPEFIYSSDGKLEKITMAPWEKIFDNVCHKYEKIRYIDRKILFNGSSLVEKYFSEFSLTGVHLQENHYANSTAGFMAMRIPEGILITCSGSLVGSLSRDDITIIHGWDNHEVLWSGTSRPSSETPLVLEMFEAFPYKTVIVHGHCRDVTYSPKTLKYNSLGYLKYGEWNELYKIKPVLEAYGKGIMKLHGEVIMANNFKEALNMYFDMYKETQ